MPAVTTAITAGKEDCYPTPLENLPQSWVCCVQGRAKLDIMASAVAIITTKCSPTGM